MSGECGGCCGVFDRLSWVEALTVLFRGHVAHRSGLIEKVGECHDTERIVFDGDDLVRDLVSGVHVVADLDSSSSWKRVDEFSPPLRIQLANQVLTETNGTHLVVLVGQKLVRWVSNKRKRADRRQLGEDSLVHGFHEKVIF